MTRRLPDVAALTDGRFIVVWKNEQVDRIEGRFVSATGTPLGNVFTISTGYAEDPKVAALPDGGFIVAWADFSQTIAPEVDGNDSGIFARRFTADGDPAGDEILVSTGDPDTDQYDPGIATDLASGRTFHRLERRAQLHRNRGRRRSRQCQGTRPRAHQ